MPSNDPALGGFSVTYSDVAAAEDVLYTATNTIQTSIDNLNAVITKVINDGGFVGDTSNAWSVDQTNWNNAAAALHEKLTVAQKVAGYISDNYKTGDQSSSHLFGANGA
ncbi:MAG TPA: WXG100 family type VII secretion target [Streptosporangiaceae bacterium]|jgi:uncharacterized protein YukE|nr:WXG100 family type VII secretion target [Streptosporangiaceae bacterium]